MTWGQRGLWYWKLDVPEVKEEIEITVLSDPNVFKYDNQRKGCSRCFHSSICPTGCADWDAGTKK